MHYTFGSRLSNSLKGQLEKSLTRLRDLPPIRKALGHSIIRWSFIKTREFEDALKKCSQIQDKVLKQILQHMSGSQITQDYELHALMKPQDLCDHLPIQTYDTLQPYIERVLGGDEQALFKRGTQIRMIATTSGTTNCPKLIPVTNRCLANLKRSWLTWGYYMGQQHPLVAENCILSLAGSYQFSSKYKKPIGSITSFLAHTMAKSTKLASVLPREFSTLESYDLRQYLALRIGLNQPNVRLLVTANPMTLIRLAERLASDQQLLISDLFDGTTYGLSNLPRNFVDQFRHLLFFKDKKRARELAKLAAKAPLNPRTIWPQMELLATWTGGHAAHYLPHVREIYGSLPLRDHGLSATEAHMTIPLTDETDEGILNIFGGFYEFIKEPLSSDNPFIAEDDLKTLLANELTTKERYEIVVSTFGGLLRYRMHDLVECTGYRGETPVLRFIAKTNAFTNIAGEKLSLWQVKEAFQEVSLKYKFNFDEYLLSAAFRPKPMYICYLEENIFFNHARIGFSETIKNMALDLDISLQEKNVEYRDKRATNRLLPLQIEIVRPGSFAKVRQKRLMSHLQHPEQYKHPYLIHDQTIDEILWSNKISTTTKQEAAS